MTILPGRPGIGPFAACLCAFLLVAGRVQGQGSPDPSLGSGRPDPRDAAAQAWIDDLYTPGVTYVGDSVHFNDETRRITTDSLYRSIIYPPAYSWAIVSALMQEKAIKPAVWHLINLYLADTANHTMVMQLILPLDEVLEMDRVLVAAYYTYIAFDPDVYTIVDGRTASVRRPDIAEKKLLATKAITEQVFAHRKAKR